VLAPPLTMALAMSWGYDVPGMAALLAYLCAALLFGRLPQGEAT